MKIMINPVRIMQETMQLVLMKIYRFSSHNARNNATSAYEIYSAVKNLKLIYQVQATDPKVSLRRPVSIA